MVRSFLFLHLSFAPKSKVQTQKRNEKRNRTIFRITKFCASSEILTRSHSPLGIVDNYELVNFHQRQYLNRTQNWKQIQRPKMKLLYFCLLLSKLTCTPKHDQDFQKNMCFLNEIFFSIWLTNINYLIYEKLAKK